MRRTNIENCGCLLLLVIAMGAGCGTDGSTRYAVSGTVTYDGMPVPFGSIHFDPDGGRNNRGPGSSAPIRDGNYSTRAGKGIVGGPYVVRIYGSDGVPVEVPGEGVNEAGTSLFAEYVERVDFPLEHTTHDFTMLPSSQAKRP